MLDCSFELDRLLLFQADWNYLSGKTWGEGVCTYINKDWGTSCSLDNNHCSEAIEYLQVKCQPRYLLQEFTGVFTILWNEPLSPRVLQDNTCLLLTNRLEAFYGIVGDFKNANVTCNFSKVSPACHHFQLRKEQAYVHKNTWVILSHPWAHLNFSSHMSIILVSVYYSLLKASRPTTKTITMWEMLSMLQLYCTGLTVLIGR